MAVRWRYAGELRIVGPTPYAHATSTNRQRSDERKRCRQAIAKAHCRGAVAPFARQGLITAITVLLGFSLTFLRFWGFEAPGQWTFLAVLSTGISIVAVVLQLIALFRSLQLEDDAESEYRKTVVWFIASAAALLVGLLLALVEASLG